MSATLGTYLQELEPEWDIHLYERLDQVAQESSNAWNNAGSGHSAFMEMNYTPDASGRVEIQRAISHAIDREQLVKVGWNNAGSPSLLPLPNFPPLARWTDPIQDLVQASEVGRYDLEETSRIMTRKGWRRDEAGFWSREGERLKMLIDIYAIFQDLTPVLIAQLQKAGFDANFRKTPDAYTRMSQGVAKAYLTGNGGSVRDPYFTLRLYHSRYL